MHHIPALLVLALPLLAMPAFSQEVESPVPPTVTFVISSGYWEEPADGEEASESAETAGEPAPADAGNGKTGTNAAPRRGYYKLIALRQPDGTAHIHLQQIEATADGPKIVSSTELEEFTALNPYVTDIRPENSAGISSEPGLFATVYLKTDPKAIEPEGWTVLIDDLGEIKVERATN